MGESDRMGCSSKQSHFSQSYYSSSANKKARAAWAGESDMKAIVVLWILISLFFLEATTSGPGDLASDEEIVIKTKEDWSEKYFLECLKHGWLEDAEGLLKIGIEKSPDSVKATMMGFIKKGNVDDFKFMIEKGPISPDFDRGLFLNEACQKGQESIVNYLLRSTNLLLPYADKCLFVASEKGYHQLVKLLLAVEGVDPAANENHAIQVASKHGHVEVVKVLVASGRVNPAANENDAIQVASRYGHVEVVKVLLKDGRADPTADDNYAIRIASQNGHAGVVNLLLKDGRVDPAARGNYAIKRATRFGHFAVVELLLEKINVDPKFLSVLIELLESDVLPKHKIGLLKAIKNTNIAVDLEPFVRLNKAQDLYLYLQLRDFVAHISKRINPVSKVLEICGKCATGKRCNYLLAALNGRLKELNTVDVPEDCIKTLSNDAEFMNDFGEKFLYTNAMTRRFESHCLSKLRTNNQITYGASTRMLVNHFKKNVNDEKILKDLFGQATLYGSEEACDVSCWTNVYSILVADRGRLRALSDECFEKFSKALKKGLVMDTDL